MTTRGLSRLVVTYGLCWMISSFNAADSFTLLGGSGGRSSSPSPPSFSSSLLFSEKYTYSYSESGFYGSQDDIDDIASTAKLTSSIDPLPPAAAPSPSPSPSPEGGAPAEQTDSSSNSNELLPPLSSNGIYEIQTPDQYHALLKAHPDKLVVIKFFASYCAACRALAPKFIAVTQDPQLEGLPIVWAEYSSSRHSKDLFRQLQILTLPTVHFYDHAGLIENFPCGPARVKFLKKKLARFLNDRVDPDTKQLLQLPDPASAISTTKLEEIVTPPRNSRDILVDNELITPEHIYYLRDDLPFFRDLTDLEFKTMLSRAKLLTFNPGDLIIRQGMPGRTFYVLKSGVAEMSVRSRFDDPLSTPSNYLGAVVNELHKFDYFGERALTTGEPLKASVRALEKTRCFAFDVDDIPESSILNVKRMATRDMVDKLNQRYELPPDYRPEYPVTQHDDCILELLVRFRQIRQAAKCFEYVMNTETINWGDSGEIARRTLLVSKLSPSQRDEFQKVFDIVDAEHRGKISLLEMRRFMDSARKRNISNAELQAMMARVSTTTNTPQQQQQQQQQEQIHHQQQQQHTVMVNGDNAINRDEFMGVMAEAEFYNLFTETFQELDKENTGYVRAGDLDEVLGGVRGLISDNPTNIVDVEDKDMLVDYEQFSKMLLGAAL
jgi:calmodulin